MRYLKLKLPFSGIYVALLALSLLTLIYSFAEILWGAELNPDYTAYQNIYNYIRESQTDLEFKDKVWFYLIKITTSLGIPYWLFRSIWLISITVIISHSCYLFSLIASKIPKNISDSGRFRPIAFILIILFSSMFALNINCALRSSMCGVLFVFAYAIYLTGNRSIWDLKTIISLLIIIVASGFHYQSALISIFISTVAIILHHFDEGKPRNLLNIGQMNRYKFARKSLIFLALALFTIVLSYINRTIRLDYLTTNMNIFRQCLYLITLSISSYYLLAIRQRLCISRKKGYLTLSQYKLFSSPLYFAVSAALMMLTYLILATIFPSIFIGSGEAFTRISIQLVFFFFPSLVLYLSSFPYFLARVSVYPMAVVFLLFNSYFGQHIYNYSPQINEIKDARLQ